jgi:hypothetical protein
MFSFPRHEGILWGAEVQLHLFISALVGEEWLTLQSGLKAGLKVVAKSRRFLRLLG